MATPIPDQPRSGPVVLYIHFVLMVLAWGVLLPWGAALASRGRERGAAGAWFSAHWKLQVAGLVAMLGGFVAAIIFAELNTAHFISPHAQLGLAVVVIGCVQGLLGAFRPHEAPANGPEGEPTKSAERVLFESVHKNLGRLAIILGLVTMAMGIFQALALNYDMAVVVTASALALISVLPVGLYWLIDRFGIPLEGITTTCFAFLGARASGGNSTAGAHAAAA
mmetsp:Transcript_22484/g.57812  ORF Transcript_22484/g.57812 Transcript_22484/m.57812 type:complete len:223 (-) Transcript_22484:2378-3046(-)